MGLAIGVFNHRLRNDDHRAFIEAMVSAIWESTTHVVVVDFLSNSADRPRDDLFFADPREMFELARRFSRRVVLHHGYMPFEFQVKLWHDDSFDTAAPAFPPYVLGG